MSTIFRMNRNYILAVILAFLTISLSITYFQLEPTRGTDSNPLPEFTDVRIVNVESIARPYKALKVDYGTHNETCTLSM